MKTMLSLFMIGLMFLTGCSGGGDESTPASVQSEAPTPRSPQPQPTGQPDMLTVTPQGILRGKANGQGQREILRAPNLQQQGAVFVDEGNIVYQRTSNAGDSDIWTVKTDGTGDRAVLNTPAEEYVRLFAAPWLIFQNPELLRSLNLTTGEQFLLDDSGLGFSVQATADRVLLNNEKRIYSMSYTGTGELTHATVSTPDPFLYGDTYLYQTEFVGSAVIFRSQVDGPSVGPTSIFSTPLAGGEIVPLEDPQFISYQAGAIGSRVVYQRCPRIVGGPFPSCDVASVNADGSEKVLLASQPANEAVQGVTTNQVIIRRNLSGNDQLIAVPVTGGAETLLMTMTDNEFVETVVEDTVIVRRPSGTWSLSLSGTLKQLNNIAGLDSFVPVGNAICSSDPVWCMPLDGSTPAVKIANTGRVVGVVQ